MYILNNSIILTTKGGIRIKEGDEVEDKDFTEHQIKTMLEVGTLIPSDGEPAPVTQPNLSIEHAAAPNAPEAEVLEADEALTEDLLSGLNAAELRKVAKKQKVTVKRGKLSAKDKENIVADIVATVAD